MAGFELRDTYPSAATLSFSTNREPILSGSGRPHETGVGVQIASSQKRMFSYRYSPAWNEHRFAFTGFTLTERDNLDAFVDAMNGGAFYVRAGESCGMLTTFTKVKLAPSGQSLPWAPQANQKWSVILILRESV